MKLGQDGGGRTSRLGAPPPRRLLLAVLLLAMAADSGCLPVLAVPASAAASTAKTYRIDAKTKLKDIFKCSHIHSIGSYNEYYVACELHVPDQNALTALEIVDVTLDGSALAPLAGVHTELTLALNTSLTSVSVRNSELHASAVELRAANVAIDAHSSINVSARGLKFGPGFNSWFGMGGSYGGMGGASLTDSSPNCDQVPPNDFFRDVGDVSGDLANFRGYGSGGGNDDSRGGGRIRLVAGRDVDLNGSLLADGGYACLDCYDSAGAGGSILISAAGRIHGNATVHANGGEPARYNADDDSGGGGGGGGGRIVFTSKDAEELAPALVEAYGGGYSSERDSMIGWCQLGGDGTILKLQHSEKEEDPGSNDADPGDDKMLVGTLLVKGGRLAHAGPVKRVQIYGCTPIFEFTSRGQRFLPGSLAHAFVSGGATVCATAIQLKASVGQVESSIVLDSGSELNMLNHDQTIRLSASQLTLQGYVGPSSLVEHDVFSLALDGGDVSLSNALLMVHELDVTARGAFSIDKYSELKFRKRVTIASAASIKIEGFLQPLEKTPTPWLGDDDPDDVPVMSLESKEDVELRPQTVEMGAVVFRIKAQYTGTVDMPFDTPFLSFWISATNVSIANVNSGPVLRCKGIENQADASSCATLNESTHEHQPYAVSVFASESASLGNISAGSMILCSENTMTIEGTISSTGLGCGSGVGPGKSEVVGDASGGAGHGGRGGNVLPGSSGGGSVYDTSTFFELSHSASMVRTSFAEKGWPIWPGSGAASGDSSNQIIGGNGGGVIYIGTKKLVVAKTASLSASGEAGAKGGGGGSGGAMTFFLSELSGGGAIALAGGAATTPASLLSLAGGANRSAVWAHNVAPIDIDDVGKIGGGGGGGVIRITYQDSSASPSSGDGEQFIKDGGNISVDGGTSMGGEKGGAGVMVGANCQPGRGGVFCLPCPEGSHSPDRFSKCTPCDPGTCSSHAGSAKCDSCPVGHFNADFGKKQCSACPLGSFAAVVGLKKCELCPPGAFADSTGSIKCASCAVGSITTASGSHNCTLCGIGETTVKVGATVCHSCTSKPVHSAFNMRGNCSYACSKGRNGLDCLTPFERLVKPIGGPLGFVVLVFSLTGLLFGAWGFIAYRSSRSELSRYAQYKAQRLRDELSLASLTRNLTPRLTNQDLRAHVARLYFSGDNHLKSAWRLNPYFLPASLRDIVEEGTYASFAEKCNELLRWDTAGWEAWAFRVLVMLLPPVSTLFMRRRQLYRVERLSKYIVRFGGRFFRDVNFRVHGTQLKVGFSPDFSLGYLDVVISSTVSASASASNLLAMQASGGEDADLVLVVAGSGSFFRPYHLDTNDIIVRAVPSRLALLEHNFWIDFAADVNQKLRTLPQPSSVIRRVREAAEVTRTLLSFVAAFNEQHVNDGFFVDFGTFSVGEAVAAEGNGSCFATLGLENVDATFESYPQEPFKLAFRVSRTASPRASPSEGQELSDTLESSVGMDLTATAGDKVQDESDPRPDGFRYSQIRMEALFAAPQRRASGLDDGYSSDDSEPLSPTSKKRRDKGGCAQRVIALVGLVCTNHTARRWLVALWQPVYPLFRLRNLAPPVWLSVRWMLPAVMLLLLLADMSVAFWIMMEYYCVQVRDPTAEDSGCSRMALGSVLGILPAALVGSPLLGLVFLTRKNLFYGKLFALWNASSVVNLAVAFLCGLAYLDFIHDGILLVALAGVLVKYAAKEVALRCLAQYAGERPLRGWRGLHTTRDWYDAAYTPLVHHED